jgi:hypothetical protein
MGSGCPLLLIQSLCYGQSISNVTVLITPVESTIVIVTVVSAATAVSYAIVNDVVPAGIVILSPTAGAVNEVLAGWLVEAVNGATPPVMLYVAVLARGTAHAAPVGIVWLAGVTVNAVVALTVSFAVTVEPTKSLIV